MWNKQEVKKSAQQHLFRCCSQYTWPWICSNCAAGRMWLYWAILLSECATKSWLNCSVDFLLWEKSYCTILYLIQHCDSTYVLCSVSSLMFLSQLTLLANMTLANQWTLKLPASEPVHHIMTFDPNDRNFLYLMTSHHVRMWLQGKLKSQSVCWFSPSLSVI